MTAPGPTTGLEDFYHDAQASFEEQDHARQAWRQRTAEVLAPVADEPVATFPRPSEGQVVDDDRRPGENRAKRRKRQRDERRTKR